MGALVTTKACLPCHKHQGYVLGNIRGGISIGLDSMDKTDTLNHMPKR